MVSTPEVSSVVEIDMFATPPTSTRLDLVVLRLTKRLAS
jgi:hypothetical protein